MRTVCEDLNRAGLLYVGTDFGLFVSLDPTAIGGGSPSSATCPPITGVRIRRKDLAPSTMGHSFCVLDNLTPLYQMDPRLKETGTARADLEEQHFFHRQLRDIIERDTIEDTEAAAHAIDSMRTTVQEAHDAGEVPEEEAQPLLGRLNEPHGELITSDAGSHQPPMHRLGGPEARGGRLFPLRDAPRPPH